MTAFLELGTMEWTLVATTTMESLIPEVDLALGLPVGSRSPELAVGRRLGIFSCIVSWLVSRAGLTDEEPSGYFHGQCMIYELDEMNSWKESPNSSPLPPLVIPREE